MGESQSKPLDSTREYNQNNNQQNYVQEDLLGKPDRRKQVQNNMIHPYSGVGKIIITITNPQTKQTARKHATGLLITKQHVLTVAHSFKYKGQFQRPLKIKYLPQPLEQQDYQQKGIQAQILHLDQSYFQMKGDSSKFYDCAILKLKQNSIIREQHILKCNFQYQFNQNKNPLDLINIPGYPSKDQRSALKMNKKTNDFLLFYIEEPPIQQTKNGLLLYEHSTTKGTSGAPLLLKKPDNSYEVVGLHLACRDTQNLGLLLKSCGIKHKIKYLINIKASPPNFMQNLLQKYLQNNKQIRIQNEQQLKLLAVNGHKFNTLQAIDLSKKQITDLGLKFLSDNSHNFQNLQKIYLQWNHITDTGLQVLVANAKNFNSLQIIYLSWNQITDIGLKNLADHGNHFKNLKQIFLSWNQITDVGLKALASNGHNLKSLETIHLSYNKITDEGLKFFAVNGHKFKSLRQIYLWSNQITDIGLKDFIENGHKFKNLQEIYLQLNKITDPGLKSIKEKLSSLRFYISI